MALVFFYWPFLTGSQTFYFKDSTNFFEPVCRFIGQAVSAGHLPLWNPYCYCGMPQAAVSSPGIFFPPDWLFGALPYSQALAFIMVFSQAVCGFATYLLVGSFGWGAFPAMLAGVLLAFNGYMFSLPSNYTLVASAAWFPLSLWGLRRMGTEAPGKGRFAVEALTAFSVFMLISAGRPEIFAPALLCLGAQLSLSCFLAPAGPLRRERLFVQVKVLAIGLLLAMPSIVPAVEWLPLSRRSGGLNAQETLMFSASWYDLINLFASQPLGDLQLKGTAFRFLLEPTSGPYFGSAFVSSIAVALSILGLRLPGKALFHMSVLALAFAIVVSLGGNVPFLSQVVTGIPALSILRFPSKLLFFVVFFLSLFAARGLRNLMQGRVTAAPALLACSAVVCCAAFLLAAPQVVLPFAYSDAAGVLLAQKAQKAIGLGLLIWGVIPVPVLASSYFLKKSKTRIFAAALTILASGLLLFHACSFCRQGASADFFKHPSFVAGKLEQISAVDIQQPGWKRFMGLFLERFSVPPVFSPAGEPQATIEAFQYGRQILRSFTNMDFGVPSSFGFEGAMNGDCFYLFLNSYFKSSQSLQPPAPVEKANPAQAKAGTPDDCPLARLLQLTSTRYLVSQDYRYLDGPTTGLSGVPEDRIILVGNRSALKVPLLDPSYFDPVFLDRNYNVRIYRVKNSLPHAYLSFNWRYCSSRNEVIQNIYEASTSGFDPAQTTLLEPGISAPPPGPILQRACLPVILKEAQPERITAEASPDRDALLVLADQYYPGWQAQVDGRQQPIFCVNGFMRAVFLPAGKHSIEFIYAPGSLLYGFLLAGLGLLWLFLLLQQEFRTESRQGKQALSANQVNPR